MTAWTSASAKSSRWLSREWAELRADGQRCSRFSSGDVLPYDVLIVGSGYGGAIAASELAGSLKPDGSPVRVAVLERGREYLPGAFPSQMSELPTQLRGQFFGRRRGGEGLFDIRGGEDVSVVQANGLGGGSLINAGVMEVPQPEIFDRRWPQALRGRVVLEPFYTEARVLLGAADAAGADNHMGLHTACAGNLPQKAEVLRRMAPADFRSAAITVAMQDGPNAQGVQMLACRRCGDCATGCNYGAKASLDVNLLVHAARLGAEIYCGATVVQIQRPRDGADRWAVRVVHTDERMRRREQGEAWLSAHRIIVAAGSLGSTELLQRSQQRSPALNLSPQLGAGFSGNGDMISFGLDYGEQGRANAVADEDELPDQREVGPTIVGVLDREIEVDQRRQRIVVEDMAVPGPLRRAAAEVLTTVAGLHQLQRLDRSAHEYGHPQQDAYAVHPQRITDMSVFAAMGDDGAQGQIRLAEGDGGSGDGQVDIQWPEIRKHPLFDAQMKAIRAMTRDTAQFDGETYPNPVWRPLPQAMEDLVGGARGSVVTVHPLGGCRMGDAVAHAVVDDLGRVFDASPGAQQPWHEGLLVLDGAIIPSALCTNPALTIAAVALRAVRQLRDDWQWTRVAESVPPAAQRRPVLRDVAAEIAERARPPEQRTVVGVTERLGGLVDLRDRSGEVRRYRVDLTLGYTPLPLSRLIQPDAQGRMQSASLTVGQDRGRLRILPAEAWERLQRLGLSDRAREAAEDKAARHYSVSGALTILRREANTAAPRILRALWAWARNRGVRDSVQGLAAALSQPSGDKGDEKAPGFMQGIVDQIRDLFRLASHAGEVRLFEYDCAIGAELAMGDAAAFGAPEGFVGASLQGTKRITFARAANPWRQLMEITLESLGGALVPGRPAVLVLDPQYLVERGQPLMRIESQRDHVEALADLGALAAYVARMMLSIHIWSARMPELPAARTPQRLPGPLPGLPEPEVHALRVDIRDGEPVQIRLTRYRRLQGGADAVPVLLIHGYSASGTTYAHPSLKPGLARELAEQGRDVWVVDLRSSAGMSGAMQAWTFEQVALTDVPAAVEAVCVQTGASQIDVVAHCMGAVMFSMAVLSAELPPRAVEALLVPRDGRSDPQPGDPFRDARRQMPQRIRRAVLSQNGPVMVMSQQNIFRAYVMSYCEALIGAMPYRFRMEAGDNVGWKLFDRFLGTLPYPEEDLRLEQHARFWEPLGHLGTRHRMDALYGRTFSLRNFDTEVLENIDDLFGPLNLDTVAQVIPFSLRQSITSRAGRNRFVSRESLRRLWRFPTLSLHGEENGLADIATLYRAGAVLRAAGCSIETRRLEGQGHQDALIGVRSPETFAAIREFLDREDVLPTVSPSVTGTLAPPSMGPMLVFGAHGISLHLGASPQLGRPLKVYCLPLQRQPGRMSVGAALATRGLNIDDTAWTPTGQTAWDTDWFELPLPSWATPGETLWVLLLYDQPPEMGGAGALHVRDDLAVAVPLDGRGEGAAPSSQAIAQAIEEAAGRLSAAEDGADESMAAVAGVVEWPAEATDLSRLNFALGSCQYPPGIFNAFPGHASWRRLGEHMDAAGKPLDMLLLTGDQIYVDATAGLFDPEGVRDRYQRPYETWLSNAAVRDVLRRVPVATLPDDHEIVDNWQPEAPDGAEDPARTAALAHFVRFQRGDKSKAEDLCLQLTQGDARFFLLDTRTQRRWRSAMQTGVSMLGSEPWGKEPWRSLREWLLDQEHWGQPKFIVSPSAILPRRRAAVRARLAFGAQDVSTGAVLRSDAWDGYPASLYPLLALIADKAIPHVVFLSGDEHLGLFTRARLRAPGQANGGTVIHSIHTAGLNTPYRFANGQPGDYCLHDAFHFSCKENASLDYSCVARTDVFRGAGFTRFKLQRLRHGWVLRCVFDDAEGIGGGSRVRQIALV